MPQRTTHQFQLSDSEFDKLYTLAELPKQVSKSVALREVLERQERVVLENAKLKERLSLLSQLETTHYDELLSKPAFKREEK